MPFASKLRHVYGEGAKLEGSYTDLKGAYTSGESSYCAANSKYFAVSKTGGGGPVVVHPLDKKGRIGKYKMVNSCKGKALDFQFHPFFDNILGVASEDASVSLTQFIDDNGEQPDVVNTPTVLMKGHTKKVHLMKFAPSAINVLASTSWDRTVKLWDVTTGKNITTCEALSNAAFSLEWTNDSKLLGLTSKDKNFMAFDPRTPSEKVLAIDEFMEGPKSAKCFWFNKFNWIGGTGFTKNARRQIKIWDQRNTSKYLFQHMIDQQSSVLMPHVDEDLNMLYLFGKGDASCAYHEMVNDTRCLYSLGVYRDTVPQKGGAFLPKRALDTGKCEVARFLKLQSDKVQPVSFMVPRKTGADIFQSDIYPDTDSGMPGLSLEDYLKGNNATNPTMSMDPANRGDDEEKTMEFAKGKTYEELVEENDKLKAKIDELQAQLAALQ